MVSDSGDGGNSSDQPKTRLIWAIIPATLVCAIIIGLGFLKAAEYEWQADKQIADYAEYTKSKKANGCVHAARADKIVCLNAASDAYREYRYNQRDLVAQKTSALWAFIMGAAAVIGMALSAVGVWLVKTTFDETRKSNEISRVQQRARMNIDFIVTENPDPSYLNVVIKGENQGFSPAINAMPIVGECKNSLKFKDFEGIEGFGRNIPGGGESQMTVIFVEKEKAIGSIIAVVIEYQCIFGDRHASYVCAKIIPSNLTQSGFVTLDYKPADWPADT